jgi:glycerol-3-phosphate dehydrogenase
LLKVVPKISGSKSLENGLLLKEALQTNYFRIVVVQDAEVVESCGALKVGLH